MQVEGEGEESVDGGRRTEVRGAGEEEFLTTPVIRQGAAKGAKGTKGDEMEGTEDGEDGDRRDKPSATGRMASPGQASAIGR